MQRTNRHGLVVRALVDLHMIRVRDRRPEEHATGLGHDGDVERGEVRGTALLDVVHVDERREDARPARHPLVVEDVVVVNLRTMRERERERERERVSPAEKKHNPGHKPSNTIHSDEYVHEKTKNQTMLFTLQ